MNPKDKTILTFALCLFLAVYGLNKHHDKEIQHRAINESKTEVFKK